MEEREREREAVALREEVVRSLDGRDAGLYGFLPYLLQDMKEMGTSAETVLRLIEKHAVLKHGAARVLDVGCGKGAVSLAVAAAYNAEVLGIDAMPAFIEEATAAAGRAGLARVTFRTGDAKREVRGLRNFDLVILGAVGPILGSCRETLATLRRCLKPGGWVVIDDGYTVGGYRHPRAESREAALAAFRQNGFTVVEEFLPERKDIDDANTGGVDLIRRRVAELKARHPDRSELFDAYVRSQEEEVAAMEGGIQVVVWTARLA